MKKYQVGGSVRDEILGRPSNDIDWVVVGETMASMSKKGFTQVGNSFPVFICPNTYDEYALARKEVSTGSGHNDFDVDFSPEVTLEEDLYRRDMTINAMAKDADGNLIDPYNGLKDIEDKILRAVGPNFSDDPLRVLRLARFRAQLGGDWTLDDDTFHMCERMVKDGMLSKLTPERVGKELVKALLSKEPITFFFTLESFGALEVVFPIIHDMVTVEENLEYHPEGNTFMHTMLVLQQAAGSELDIMVSALTHDFGKTLTHPDNYPAHHGHENVGVPLVAEFCHNMRLPTNISKIAQIMCKFHMHMKRLEEMKSTTIVKMFDKMGAWNQPELVDKLVKVGICDARGKLGFDQVPVDHIEVLNKYFTAARKVKFMDIVQGEDWKEWSNDKRKQALYNARVKAVQEVKNESA